MNPWTASEILGDNDIIKILTATQDIPMGVREIKKLLSISTASCYRKLQILKKLGLLKVAERWNSKTGRRDKVYISQIEEVHIAFSNGKFRIRFKVKPGAKGIDEIWNVTEIKKSGERIAYT